MKRFLQCFHAVLLAAAPWAVVIAPEARAAADVTDNLEYRVGADDVLDIRVWGHPNVGSEVTVNAAGRVQLPLVGSVMAGGLTPEELGRELSQRFSLIDPTMTDVIVTVVEYRSMQVTVVGEAREPGRHGFREIPDLWSAIHAAGGATPEADLGRVQIVRRDSLGEPRTIVVDLSGGLEATAPGELPELRARDTVVIPALTEGVTSRNAVHVLGAVRSPGIYRVTLAETVIGAVAASGGPLGNANMRDVRLTRPRRDGAIAYRLDLRSYLYEGGQATDLRLRPGDTITVPETGTTFGGVMRALFRFIPLATAVTSLIVVLY